MMFVREWSLWIFTCDVDSYNILSNENPALKIRCFNTKLEETKLVS